MARLLPLSRGYHALVDDDDYDALQPFRWFFHHGYAARTVRHQGRAWTEYMHRRLLDAPPGQQVDHRDGDGLNNTRANLRLASPAENQRNKAVSRNSRTGYKGVGAYRDKFQARIKVTGKRIHLGYFPDAVSAALMYDAAARHFHGDFARVNFPNCPTPSQLHAQLLRQLEGTESQPRAPRPSLGRSRYRGVSSERGQWRAKITIAGRTIHLGYFASEVEAARAYDRASLQYRGPAAFVNLPDVPPAQEPGSQ